MIGGVDERVQVGYHTVMAGEDAYLLDSGRVDGDIRVVFVDGGNRKSVSIGQGSSGVVNRERPGAGKPYLACHLITGTLVLPMAGGTGAGVSG